jgi:23S rRNA pseudouridine2457 synthase
VIIAFNKPYGVVTQFTPLSGHPTLSEFGLPKDLYPCGRLDHDSEGLLLLTENGSLQARLSSPRYKLPKSYWAQVERIPPADALKKLAAGIKLNDGLTRPCQARLLPSEPVLPPRDPPIRYRKNVPTAWIELVLTEGRNRQVRRMTAAVGHPTLRLVRAKIGGLSLAGLAPGAWKAIGLGEIGL